MLVIKTQKEFNSFIKNGVASFDCDVDIKCSIATLTDIKVNGDINAWDIKAMNIKAMNINAMDIKAWDVNARDIKAIDIKAWNIDAWDISFYAVAFACESFQCKSISGHRENSKYFCLDSEVVIKGA